jgi:hypothetical protein
MVETLNDLYEKIQELTSEERVRLLANLNMDISKQKTSEPLNREETAVLDALMRAADVSIPDPIFLKSFGKSAFRASASDVIAFARGGKTIMRAPELAELIYLCMRCLAKHLRSREIPATPKVMMENMSLMPAAVDRAYPGYAKAGMLHALVCSGRSLAA